MTLSQTLRRLCVAAAVVPALAGPVLAADYPTRPVTVVVPFPAGGPTDAIARIVARSLESQSGQPFVVENRAGAGSTLGTAYVANATPDGYTLLWGSSSGMVIAPQLYTDLRYDPFTSFAPIGMVASTPFMLLVRDDAPFATYEDLVAYGRANPDKLNYATPGLGTLQHLSLELMSGGADFTATHIPFKGGAPAMNALLAGDVDYLIEVPIGATPRVEAKTVRALAVTSEERIESMPDVPTLQEKGHDGFRAAAWFAMFAPAEAPQAAVDRLRAMLAQAMEDPDVLATLAKTGFDAAPVGADYLSDTIRREYDTWGEVIRDRGIQMD